MTTRALFKHYPAIRYKNGVTQRVDNKTVDDSLMADGWTKTPANAIEQLEHIHKGDENSKHMLTQVVDKIAAIVNMLERIEKVRSKKDLYWLGEQLAIMLKPDMSLKDMKKADSSRV